MKPSRAVASFDSASGMLRALASYLHGRDHPLIGVAPSGLEPFLSAVLGQVNRLPRRLRERLYSWSGWSEALPQSRVGDVRGEVLADWVVGHYPRRRYPAVAIGSSNGAGIHLCAALGIPWLPQTLLIPVRHGGVDPDDPTRDLAESVGAGRALLRANPDMALHHMHDANQDRLMVARMTYFRVKWLSLPLAYERFLLDTLEPAGSLLVLNCRLRWPTVRLGDRHVFQHGALGGCAFEEYQHGSERVEAFLGRYRSRRRQWNVPAPDEDSAEAEWGFESALGEGVAGFAERHGYRLNRLIFDQPEALSPLVADLHREWYARRGLPINRLLVESFLLIEPWWTLRTGSVPWWVVFDTEASLRAVADWLDGVQPFDEIRATLFSHGVDSIGLADVQQWAGLLLRARKVGSFLGVDEQAFPRDFANLARYHRDLTAVRARYPMPPPLSFTEGKQLVHERAGRYDVAWKTS